MRYTTKEILDLAGVTNPEEVVGKMRVNIGGLAVNKLDHVIDVQEAGELRIVVGREVAMVNIPLREEVSEDVEIALKAKGDKSTADFAERHPERFEKEQGS